MFVAVTPVTRKTFEAEVETAETRTWKAISGVGRRQDEARRPPLSEGDGEDDWFFLFDSAQEKPVVLPPGTFLTYGNHEMD